MFRSLASRILYFDEDPDVKLFHILPMKPEAGFISLKLSRLAAAAASVLLRFWLIRLENMPDEEEPLLLSPPTLFAGVLWVPEPPMTAVVLPELIL